MSEPTVNRTLDPELIIGIYRRQIEETGKASCASVVAELSAQGVTTRTGRPPTRQGIHYILKHHPEGRELIEYTLRRTGKLAS